MKKLKPSVSINALLMILFFSGSISATPIFYDSRAAFDIAAGPLTGFEDFEEAKVDFVGATGPWNSLTDNDIFSSGDLAEGISFNANGGLVAASPGIVTPSWSIFPNVNGGTMDITFSVFAVNAVGLDLFNFFGGDLTVSLFDTNDALITSMSVSDSINGRFFGVVDTMNMFSRINISGGNHQAEGIDNIAFGRANSTRVPEPVSFTLFGVGLAGLSLVRRWRKDV